MSPRLTGQREYITPPAQSAQPVLLSCAPWYGWMALTCLGFRLNLQTIGPKLFCCATRVHTSAFLSEKFTFMCCFLWLSSRHHFPRCDMQWLLWCLTGFWGVFTLMQEWKRREHSWCGLYLTVEFHHFGKCLQKEQTIALVSCQAFRCHV